MEEGKGSYDRVKFHFTITNRTRYTWHKSFGTYPQNFTTLGVLTFLSPIVNVVQQISSFKNQNRLLCLCRLQKQYKSYRFYFWPFFKWILFLKFDDVPIFPFILDLYFWMRENLCQTWPQIVRRDEQPYYLPDFTPSNQEKFGK